VESKIKDLKNKKCYILEFQCREARPGRHVVIAYNGHQALNIFLKHWKEGFEAGEFDIPADELQNLRVEEWCGYWDGMLGRF
jgi:hypothetical protein